MVFRKVVPLFYLFFSLSKLVFPSMAVSENFI